MELLSLFRDFFILDNVTNFSYIFDFQIEIDKSKKAYAI